MPISYPKTIRIYTQTQKQDGLQKRFHCLGSHRTLFSFSIANDPWASSWKPDCTGIEVSGIRQYYDLDCQGLEV